MNISIDSLDKGKIEGALSLIHKYDCRKYVYFTSKNEGVLKYLSEIAPDLGRCFLGDSLESALKYNCSKIQISKINKELIEKAHKNDIRCNFETNERKAFDVGIDTIITNDYSNISRIIK